MKGSRIIRSFLRWGRGRWESAWGAGGTWGSCGWGEDICVRGRLQGRKVAEEGARVWVFDTNRLGWSYVDPASDAEIPPARYLHGGAASEHP